MVLFIPFPNASIKSMISNTGILVEYPINPSPKIDRKIPIMSDRSSPNKCLNNLKKDELNKRTHNPEK